MVITMNGEVVGDLPIDPLAEASPESDRPWVRTAPREEIDANALPAIASDVALKQLMGSPHLCSRRWIWEQYDHMVMTDTVARPGGDAAIVRIHGTNRAIAATSDCTVGDHYEWRGRG